MTGPNRQLLVNQLIAHEGLRLSAYPDGEGYLTIGVGRLIDSRRGGGITRDEALALLDRDINAAIADLVDSFTWFSSLDDVRQRAVIDLRFNLGGTGLRTFVHFLHDMAIKDYHGAAHELRNSKWATQVGDRARAVAAMIETGTE